MIFNENFDILKRKPAVNHFTCTVYASELEK